VICRREFVNLAHVLQARTTSVSLVVQVFRDEAHSGSALLDPCLVRFEGHTLYDVYLQVVVAIRQEMKVFNFLNQKCRAVCVCVCKPRALQTSLKRNSVASRGSVLKGVPHFDRVCTLCVLATLHIYIYNIPAEEMKSQPNCEQPLRCRRFTPRHSCSRDTHTDIQSVPAEALQ
jgi:hypothetical protein